MSHPNPNCPTCRGTGVINSGPHPVGIPDEPCPCATAEPTQREPEIEDGSPQDLPREIPPLPPGTEPATSVEALEKLPVGRSMTLRQLCDYAATFIENGKSGLFRNGGNGWHPKDIAILRDLPSIIAAALRSLPTVGSVVEQEFGELVMGFAEQYAALSSKYEQVRQVAEFRLDVANKLAAELASLREDALTPEEARHAYKTCPAECEVCISRENKLGRIASRLTAGSPKGSPDSPSPYDAGYRRRK